MKEFQSDKPLQFFVEQIRERLGNHLKQIILFGSRARGDHVPDSDYDCLIVLDEVTSGIFDIIDDVAGETLYQFDTVLSVFPITEKKYNTDKFHPLYMNAKKEGVYL